MIRFAHTNIITDDWQRLARFYIDVFDCKPLYPERDLKGEWLDAATGFESAHLKGIHLILPGYEANAPTLEIFEYAINADADLSTPNRKGFGHIAFKTDDVHATLQKLLDHGGAQVGAVVETDIENAGHICFVYARDIDGNIIELQHWK